MNICDIYYVRLSCRLLMTLFFLTAYSLLRVMIRYNTPTFCSPTSKKNPRENLKLDILSVSNFFESSWQKSRKMEVYLRWKIYFVFIVITYLNVLLLTYILQSVHCTKYVNFNTRWVEEQGRKTVMFSFYEKGKEI